MFGSGKVDFMKFESTLIASLLQVFFRENGSLSFRRVLPYSMFVGFIASLILIFWFNPGEFDGLAYIIVPSMAFGLILSPIDYLSLSITKALFIDRVGGFSLTVRFLIDLILSSMLASVVLGVCISAINYFHFGSYGFAGPIIAVLGIGAVASTIAISIVQLISVIGGATLRFSLKPLGLFEVVSRHSNILNVPFLFIGFLFGTLTYFLVGPSYALMGP